MILKKLIEKLGHDVECACDGLQAIEKLEVFSPDIILLDAIMPNMDGFEAATIIKRNLGDNFIPIIFLTSLNDDQSLIKGLDAGGLSSLLTGERKEAKKQDPTGMSVLENLLDTDNDGQIADDVVKLGGSLLGSLFGPKR